MNLKIANDNGNSEQDLMIDGDLVRQPNLYAKVAKLPNLEEYDKKYVLENLHENLIVAIEGGLYYIGTQAINSGKVCRTIEVGVDNNKITSDIVYINTLAHTAAGAVKKAYKEKADLAETIKVNVDMTTALPVSYYNKKNANEFAEKFTAKKHHITVYVADMEVQVEIIYDFVKVIPEGVTATFALNSSDFISEYNQYATKRVKADYFKNKKILHIAIGEGTTEFPVTEGLHFKPDFISGTNNGNGHAIDAVLNDFKNEYGLMKLSRQEYSKIIADEKHKYHDKAVDFIEPEIEIQAEEIFHEAQRVIQQANNEIDIICVYGGGSILMRKELENKLGNICKRGMIDLIYMPKEYAVTLEVKGLNEFLNSPIYEKVKEIKLAQK